MSLILASTSSIRRQMLDAAGVEYDAVAPDVDEEALKATFPGDDTCLSRALAEAKACNVSEGAGTRDWVVGSDSIVSVNGRRFSKPKDKADAVEHLRFFRGRSLQLTSAVALARDGKAEWTSVDTAWLNVRDLSDRFIVDYLDLEWPAVSYCVGVFRMEGRGVQLFSNVEGNHFTILGMPLLPLLGALRERGLVAS